MKDMPVGRRRAASKPSRWASGPWEREAGPVTWLQRYWRWLLKPRSNRRRRTINLALMGLWLLGAVAFSVLASVGHHWWLLIPAAFGLPEGLLGTAENMTKLDLEDLGVPKGTKPVELVASSPPGSVLHRTAVRAVRLHRSERVTAVAIWVAGIVTWAATA